MQAIGVLNCGLVGYLDLLVTADGCLRGLCGVGFGKFWGSGFWPEGRVRIIGVWSSRYMVDSNSGGLWRGSLGWVTWFGLVFVG